MCRRRRRTPCWRGTAASGKAAICASARDLGKEDITEAWALQLVEIDGLVQLALGGDVEAQAGAHPRRAGALASISLARRGPPDGGTQLKRAKPEQP